MCVREKERRRAAVREIECVLFMGGEIPEHTLADFRNPWGPFGCGGAAYVRAAAHKSNFEKQITPFPPRIRTHLRTYSVRHNSCAVNLIIIPSR